MKKQHQRAAAIIGVLILLTTLATCASLIPEAIDAEQAKQRRIANARLEAMKSPPKWSTTEEFTVFELLKD
jgi:hypothetical protein